MHWVALEKERQLCKGGGQGRTDADLLGLILLSLLSEWLAIYFLKERVCRNVWRLNLRKTRNVWQKTLRCFIVPYSTWEKRKFKNDTVQCCDLWQLEWTNMKYIAFYPKYDTLLCFSYTSFLTILSYQKYHRILMNQINP